MRTQIFIVATILMFSGLAANLCATTIDPKVNTDRRPSLALDVALGKAKEALGEKAKDFACTRATSITRKSGGGWGFFFRSRTHAARYVEINMKKEVIANHLTSAKKGGQFKAPPKQTIEQAIELAVGTKTKPRRWFPLHCYWDEDDQEWGVALVNAHRDKIEFSLDKNGKIKELKEPEK